MRRHPGAFRSASLLLIGFTVLAGCGRKHYLAEYQFAEKTMALVWVEPPSPELRTGWYNLRPSRNPVEAAMRVGGGVAKEVEARKASVRLDSAVTRVDINNKLAQRTLERASVYLGTRPVQNRSEADFVLEIDMHGFGIDARSNNAAYLFTRAEAILVDRRSGREIWSVDIHSSDRMTPFVIGTRTVPSSIFTAATLHSLSVQDFQDGLEQLVVFSSNAITRELREKLREARDPR